MINDDFGDGSDGDIYIGVGEVLHLTRDMQYNNVLVAGKIANGPYKLRVANELSLVAFHPNPSVQWLYPDGGVVWIRLNQTIGLPGKRVSWNNKTKTFDDVV